MIQAIALAYNKDIIRNRKLVAVIGVTFFIIATTLGAYVRVPVYGSPVPITLQTFFVLLAGAVLGKKLGLYSQVGYLMLGASGLQVFQGASLGVSYLLGPTGGYLVGFMACALLVGSMIGSAKPTVMRIIAIFAIGSLVIYASGALWLILAYKMSLAGAIASGVLPFILGDMAKITITALLFSKISDRSRQIFSS